MAEKERSAEAMLDKFTGALGAIKDSQVEGISDMAGRIEERLQRKDLSLAIMMNRPTLTSFHFISGGPMWLYSPRLVIDAGKMSGANPEKVQGDLVRTIAIADQFPFNGFERRYGDVYDQAIQQQERWLEETDAPTILLDPRTTEKESLKRKLLGDPRYFADVGFSDLQKFVANAEQPGGDSQFIFPVERLKEKNNLFFGVRETAVQAHYQDMRGIYGDEYHTEWDTEKRAAISAASLIDAYNSLSVPSGTIL